MKKRLLFASFALMCAGSALAFEAGDYVYTSSQRVKVTGENLLSNGDFADGLEGWTAADKEAADPEVWSLEMGAGPNGENTVKSLSAAADKALCRSLTLEPGTYLVSFQIKGVAAANLYPGGQGTTAVNTYSANTADIFVNNSGSLTRVFFDDQNPGFTVSGDSYIDDSWRTINFFTTIDEGQVLVLHLERMAADTELANFCVQAADEVYDDRALLAKVAHIKNLMAMQEFAAGDASSINEALETVEGAIAAGALDDISTGEEMYSALDEPLEAFLSQTSVNLGGANGIFTTDLTTVPKINRGQGQMNNDQIYYTYKFHGDNWWHGQNNDFFTKQIQGGGSYQVGPGSASFYNKYLPAGKYYISGEMRNAYCQKDYKLLWNVENKVSAYVGYNDDPTTFTELGTISGEEYKRFTYIADFDGQSEFEAGFWWDGPLDAGTLHLRNVEIRAFNMNAIDEVKHNQVFEETFLPQYNAAVAAHNDLIAMQGDGNYPWDQAVLAEARATYDPTYDEFMSKGWVIGDGVDAGVASTDELEYWAKFQGGEEPEDGKATYYLVRGYQNATNTVKATNKPFTDLATAIDDAKTTRNQGVYFGGDRDKLKEAIMKAITTIREVRANTSDATREADTETLNAATEELKAAVEAFINSVSNAPIVDIDFSNTFEEATDAEGNAAYVVKGAAGEMTFTAVQLDNTVADYQFALGYNGELNDVLHVGGDSYGEALIGEVGDNDALKITFDLWFGQLGKAFQYVDLVNAAGERVAGFSYDSYNSNTEYNEFDNAANKGMLLKGNVKSNHDKSGGAASVCTDALRNSFELNVNYMTGKVQGTIVQPSKTTVGVEVDMVTPESGDNKIAAFRIGGRNHQKANSGAFGRRAWFDNLKVSKLTAHADYEEDIMEDGWANTQGISTIVADKAGKAAVYTLSGVQVKNVSKPGLYIQNGKKFAVK